MAKKPKRQSGQSFKDYLNILEKNKNIGEDDVNLQKDIEDVKLKAAMNSEKLLALNFALMTTKEEFNFQYLKTQDKGYKSEFLGRFVKALEIITSKRVRELREPPFTDKFTYNSYEPFYSHPEQELQNETELISIEVGGKVHERMICWKKNISDNILYVLGFQFTFSNPIYITKHHHS